MTKIAGGILLMMALSVGVMLTWVGGAAAATPISACGFTISVSGSYVLTANLSSPDTNDCITVAANNVSIDFNGFVIDGAGEGAGVTDGGTSHKSIAVRNGTIRGKTGGAGIALGSSTSVIVHSMTLAGNQKGAVVGSHGIVKNSTISDNTFIGVVLGSSSSVTDSTIHNSVIAVIGGLSHHVTLARNTISGNVTSTFLVIELGDHASVHDNTVINNTALVAIVAVGPSSVVTRNTVLHNSAAVGIVAADHSRVNYNVANANAGFGIGVDANSDVVGNVAIGNGGDGISVNCPSTVKFNTAFGNTGTNLNETGAGCTNVGNNAP